MGLTATEVRNAKARSSDYRLHDGGGLYLHVRKSGAKAWLYRDRTGGKDTFLTLGNYPAVSLAAARADVAQRKLARDRKSATVVMPEAFGVIAEEWFKQSSGQWGEAYTKSVRRVLERDILPELGNTPIDEITSRACLQILQAIASRGAATVAVQARTVMGMIFKYAIINLHCENDPTSALKGAIKPAKTKHSPALTKHEFTILLKAISNSTSRHRTKTALHILARTFVRTNELAKSTWDEFDLVNSLWTISGQRMKNKVPHVVPLSDQVVTLLEGLPKNSHYVFPNESDASKHMNLSTCNVAVRSLKLQFKFSPHGFRSTASTILNQSGYRGDIIERQLSHVPVNQVRAAYNAADYLDERRAMMQWWSDEIDRLMAS
ncbi:hypothetical protein BWR19_07035 [Halomonas sp. 1513]|nr:tyrosine-type recombinase/integrase [Halomonas sp. 1513]APX92704.1 hypothetical protein BWR19_07035 [Halomonas sp. 1513]